MFKLKLILLFKFFFFFYLASFESFASDKKEIKEEKEEKIYTKSQFDEELKKKLEEKVQEKVEIELKKVHSRRMTQFAGELLKKDQSLEKGIQEIEKEKEQLVFIRRDLEQKIVEVEKKQNAILNCLSENEKSKGDRIQRLVTIITKMKPDKAAELLSVQESEIAVKILSLLAPEVASKIFNLMDKEISARIQGQYLNMKK